MGAPKSEVDAMEDFTEAVAQERDSTIDHICNLAGVEPSMCCAKACLASVKGGYKKPHMPLPKPCARDAPDEINVYTDGSWLNPTFQFAGLGGSGAWWPRRANGVANITSGCPVNRPISDAEQEMAYEKQTPNGLQLYTKIGGFGGSSTRTELAAGIIAMSAHGPVHIGTDSMAFKQKADWVLESVRAQRRVCD